jgi:putative ABC transport system ATP-binding protein
MTQNRTTPEPNAANQGSPPLISLHGVYKYYESGAGKTFVLQGVGFDILAGDFVSIMGPSGAGKSTLLHIIGLLDEPNDGEYQLLGQSVMHLKEKERSNIYKQHIGFVFQSYHLIDELTVYENLETPLLYKGVDKSERKSLVADTLDKFQIVGKKDLFPSQLSGGQQQLVGIARAVITSPKLILADEPTGNLNSAQGEEIMALFSKLNREGTTIIQVTHSEKNAAYGKRIINLLDGRIQ